MIEGFVRLCNLEEVGLLQEIHQTFDACGSVCAITIGLTVFVHSAESYETPEDTPDNHRRVVMNKLGSDKPLRPDVRCIWLWGKPSKPARLAFVLILSRHPVLRARKPSCARRQRLFYGIVKRSSPL